MKTTTKRKIAKRRSEQPQPAITPDQPAIQAPISTTLSPQASKLVRWYCGVTKHQEEAAIEGAVFGNLERAKDAYEQGSCHSTVRETPEYAALFGLDQEGGE